MLKRFISMFRGKSNIVELIKLEEFPQTLSNPIVPSLNLAASAVIQNYCQSPHAQQYALMISGNWGSGKTFLVRSVLDHINKESKRRAKPLYVTLYGVRDTAEIGEQLFQQIHPILSHKGTRFAGAVLKGMAKMAIKFDLDALKKESALINVQIPDLKLSDLTSANHRVIVFDDFERSVLDPTEILGFINPLVEHEECKVIIIANESEILSRDNDEYRKKKEKTIGRTVTVKPDINSAFEDFRKQIIDPAAQEIISNMENKIVNLFNVSDTDNLRILKQFLFDFEYFLTALTDGQKNHNEAVSELTLLLLATALEVRSGRVDPAIFRLRDMQFSLDEATRKVSGTTNELMDSEHDALLRLFNRYPSVNFSTTLIDAKTVREFIVSSILDTESIQKQLLRHTYFTTFEALPSWRALWYSFELEGHEADVVVERFVVDFEARVFIKQGEILHIIGLCLWLTRIDYPGWTESTTEARIVQYITDIFSRSFAEGDDLRTINDLGLFMGGYEGLGFREASRPKFKELSVRLNDEIKAWKVRGYPIAAAEILRELVGDGQAFLDQTTRTKGRDSIYADIPILREIAPEEFVDSFSRLSYVGKKNVLLAMSIRYEHVGYHADLVIEQTWVREIHRAMKDYAQRQPAISRDYLDQSIDMYFGKIFNGK